jgi:hypothetical protein
VRFPIRWASARRVGARRAAVALAAALALAPSADAGRGADGDFEQRTSAHFVLYQDVAIDEAGGFHGSRRFEQQVLDELERAYEALDRRLGLRPARRLDVVVYDPDVFDATFAGLFRFPAAGFYGGVIRVRGDTRLTGALSRVLHHELVHAALDAAAPSLVLPAWVNEGGAEWFEVREAGKRALSAGERRVLAELARSGELHDLATLSAPSFAGFGSRAAQIAYLQSYALIDHLARRGGERKLAQWLAELMRSRHLGRALRRVYRIDADELDAALRRELS